MTLPDTHKKNTGDSAEDSKARLLGEWERWAQDRAGAGPDWLTETRRSARNTFELLGFPTRRDEEWRFTDIRPLLDTPFALADFGTMQTWLGRNFSAFVKQAYPHLFDKERMHRVVFVNGLMRPETADFPTLPQPSGVTITTLATALESMPERVKPHLARTAGADGAAFTALNTAFLEDGAFIHIPRNIVVNAPILLVYLSVAPDGPTLSHPRTLIVAEAGSQATIIETYAWAGDGGREPVYFTNAVTEIVAGENAVVEHYKVNRESANAFHVATTQIELARGANFASQSVTLGGALVRNDFNAELSGEGIECTLNGLYLGRDRQLIDNHTAINHAQPHCNSHETYKGILADRSRGVFNGKIFVQQDAQKTDAKQTNQTLLLSDEAQINTKPQLEIFADDVKCTHGATVGQLSKEAIFYLRSRGIGASEARNMLTFAFANDVVSRIKVEPLRDELERVLLQALPG